MDAANLSLVLPEPGHKELWQNFNNEFNKNDEKIIPSAARSSDGTFETFLQSVTNYHLGIDIKQGFVQASTYFLMDEKRDKILGATNIRHSLNEYLLKIGGHIGYGVAPSERRKGYATVMLAMALEKCCEIGIEKALVTCDKINIGSAKTILNNGGILENEYTEDNGNTVQRYWIYIK